MDKQKINTYILFLIHRFNAPQNEYETSLKTRVDQWRRVYAQEFLLSIEDSNIYNILSQMYKATAVLMESFRSKTWYRDDNSLVDMAIKPVRDLVVTPKETQFVARFLRIMYFPEFLSINNNMDIDTAVSAFKNIYSPIHQRDNVHLSKKQNHS
jgi:hypothetical protein